VLAVAAAAALLLLPGTLRLRLLTDGRSLVDPGDPVARRDAEVRARFGLREPLAVLVESSRPEGIFDPAALAAIQRMSAALERLPGIGPGQVMSLATERRDEVFPGTLVFRTFLDPLPATARDVARLRGDLAAAGLLTGTLVSASGRTATVLVGVPPGDADRAALCRQVEATVRPFAGGPLRVSVVGAPAAEALLGRHILADLALLLPLALLKVALVLWVACRRPWPVALALAKAAACAGCTLGLMGWLGVPLRLPAAILPVLLATLALAEEMHVFFRYQRRLSAATDGPHPSAVRETLRQLAKPAVLTALAMATGFLCLLVSPLAAIRTLGAFAAAGVLAALAWTLTVTPAALTLLPPARMARRFAAPPAAGATVRLVAPLLRRPRLAAGVLGGLTLVAAAGAARLEVQDSWVSGFAPGSPFRRATERADRELLGTHLLLVELTTDAAGSAPLLEPRRLRAIADFESWLRTRPGVGGVLGPTDQLAAAHYLWMARRAGARRVPDEPREIAKTLDRLEMARGVERRREFVDDARRATLVTVFLKGANYRDARRLTAAIGSYGRGPLAAASLRLALAGDVAVSQRMIASVVAAELAALALTLAAAWLAVALLWRSPGRALAAVLPSTLAVGWTFGAMGWLGIPLGIATAMFCAIALGIGVDYAVHLLEEVERAAAGGATEDPVREAVAAAGPAIVADSLAMGLGFALLAFSRVPANARLGQLVAFALFASCLLTLGGLAPLARAVEGRSAGTAGVSPRSEAGPAPDGLAPAAGGP
jgi:uncharacterized protein